jgi:hypothetical protein
MHFGEDMDNNRNLTSDEKKWVTRLLKCLNSMPASIEISVLCSGTVNIMNNGALQKHFNDAGDADNPPTLTWITPKTADRIDGRDSQT